MKIEEKTILITGATGFVGKRLTENLLSTCKDVNIRCLVHDPSNAKKIAGLPVKKVTGDMASLSKMREVVSGCNIVVHCAMNIDEYSVNVKGTSNLLKAASEASVERFVYLSSCSAFGYLPKTYLNGDRLTYQHLGDTYCDSKIDSERIAFQYSDQKKLPLVILRPTHIYGPNSQHWTLWPLSIIKNGGCLLVDGGNSPANILYIDNLVYAIKLAIANDNAVGRASIISDDESVTWKEFFAAYARMLKSTPALHSIASKELEKQQKINIVRLYKKMLLEPGGFLTMLFRILKAPINQASLPKLVKSEAIDIWGESSGMPTGRKLNELTYKTQLSIEYAKEFLGYKPPVSFGDAMKQTEIWLKTQNLI